MKRKTRSMMWNQRSQRHIGTALAIGVMALGLGTQAAFGAIIVDENFDALADGATPAGSEWTIAASAPNSTVGAQSVIKAGASGKAILLDEVSAGSQPQLFYAFTAPGAEATQLSVEFDAYNVAGSDGNTRSFFYLGSTASSETEITTELFNGSILVLDSSARRTVKSVQTRGQWNNLRYEVDLVNSTYDLFVNDELVVNDSGFLAASDGVFNALRWRTDQISDGALAIDNLSVTTVAVPEPASIGLLTAGFLFLFPKRRGG